MVRFVNDSKAIFAASLSRLFNKLVESGTSFALIGSQDKDTKEIRQDELYALAKEYNDAHRNGYNKAFGRYVYQDGPMAGQSADEPSVVLYNIPFDDALEIAKKINQESIVFKDDKRFGVYHTHTGKEIMSFFNHGLSFNAKDTDGNLLADTVGTMIADRGSWSSKNPKGKKPYFVFSACLGRPSSWKLARIVSATSEELKTTYRTLFTVEVKGE